ncbi:hypothetical protein PPYR_13088 [Photinus pyralis]|uniref:Trimethyllysine dioxygenase, mitochondrial n=2 Tax=Photinus pyralis TaxID=7054 RepID=A0A1Y1MIC5_PHOPY|nr:trimethyllysine dioxygenase, mitochondrial [Photinus pyralis]KAB0793468.1 hypothetical protein PPYR_13088 [Photinus pyralis]
MIMKATNNYNNNTTLSSLLRTSKVHSPKLTLALLKMENLETVQVEDEWLYVKFGEHGRRFYYLWLRDNCKCEKCYSTFYNQILFNILDIPSDIKPISCEIVKDKLLIIWMDKHKTEYEMKWLESITFPLKHALKTILWDRKVVPKKIPLEFYLNDKDGLKSLISAVTTYGFGIVTGVQNTLEATESVVRHLASVQKTYFGEMWKVTTDSSCNDTSTTNVALLPHNDNTYWSNAAGLQVFHLLNRNGEGGHTILVDGFNIAEKVRKRNVDSFNLLCNSAIESHFIDKDQHYFCTDPVIKLHSATKQLHQIRFNVYDRSPLVSLPEGDIPRYYEAYKLFASEAFDRENQYEIQLEPGDVIFIDNWRVLHGRREFMGTRELGGCYVSRDDYLSRVKQFYPTIN